ncbi:MAG: thiamine-monophosphate kinase [Gammaproteobacteria bacterium]|jgi:thiamine-monophosphate kinase
MPSDEFNLIRQYFAGTGSCDFPARLSQGDDAAVIDIPPGFQLLTSVDTLVEGRHFLAQCDAADLACKALAVNLSDLAAMASKPAWFLLSLTLPENNASWLRKFSDELKKISLRYQVELIGGDTCRGPLSITIQVMGLAETNRYVSRSGAKTGDKIVVSGELGTAAIGLAGLQGKIELNDAEQIAGSLALNRPIPRLDLIDLLQSCASSAIDLSDGLVGDLRHLIEASGKGARLVRNDIPVSSFIKSNKLYDYALTGGDDYELCFTVPDSGIAIINQWNTDNPQKPLLVIGEIIEEGYYLETDSESLDLSDLHGFQHF